MLDVFVQYNKEGKLTDGDKEILWKWVNFKDSDFITRENFESILNDSIIKDSMPRSCSNSIEVLNKNGLIEPFLELAAMEVKAGSDQ